MRQASQQAKHFVPTSAAVGPKILWTLGSSLNSDTKLANMKRSVVVVQSQDKRAANVLRPFSVCIKDTQSYFQKADTMNHAE